MFSKLLSLLAVVVLVAACADKADNPDSTISATQGNAGLSANEGGSRLKGSGETPGVNGIQPGTQEDLAAINGQGTGDRVFFPTDRSDLTPDARATLTRQAAWLKQYTQVTVTIEGHADERGTREYNLGLGNRRATEVKNYLVILGITPDRIAIISYGKEKPALVGDNEAAWAQNRRGVTVVN